MLISLIGHVKDSGDKQLDLGEGEFDSGWNHMFHFESISEVLALFG